MRQIHVPLFILLLTSAVPALGQHGFDLICSDAAQEALPDSFVVYRFTLWNTGLFTDTFGLVLPLASDSLPCDEWFSQLWIDGSSVPGTDTAYVGLAPDSADTTIQVRVYTYSIYPSWGTGRTTLLAWSQGDTTVRDSVSLRVWLSYFVRGDVDGSGALTLGDAVRCLRCQFVPGWSDSCRCDDAIDADDNGAVSTEDCFRILRKLFLPGWQDSVPPPCCDAPQDCSVDPTPDELGCQEHRCMGGSARTGEAKPMR